MTLGWKPALTNEVYEPFMRSGTMHIFAMLDLPILCLVDLARENCLFLRAAEFKTPDEGNFDWAAANWNGHRQYAKRKVGTFRPDISRLGR